VHLRTTNPIESAFATVVALVRAGAKLENGELVERPDDSRGDRQAA
jgi:hypothetical protein